MLAFSLQLFAQTIAGSISGSVRDGTGGRIPRVLITIRSLDTGLTRTLNSEQDGSFQAPGLSSGRYRIKIERTGFQTLVLENIILSHGQDLALDPKMELGQTATEIMVQADSIPTGVKAGLWETWMQPRKIQNLPLNGRNVFDLALLLPGVARFPQRPAASDAPILNHGTWMSINGANARSNSFLLDGTLVNNSSVAASGSIIGTTLGVEAIREFQVLTSAYSAEYGRVAGGIINAVTRGGTNRFHGDVFEYHRNKAFDARNFFDGNTKPNFVRNQFGFSIGGPIKKDRAFFFATTEWLRERLGVTRVSPVPDAQSRSGAVAASAEPYLKLFPLPNGPSLGGGLALFSFPSNQPTDETFHQSRVDHQLSDKTHLFARYTLDLARRLRPGAYPAFFQDSESYSHFATVESSILLSPRWLSVSRLSYSRTDLVEENRTRFDAETYKVHPAVPTFPQLVVGELPLFGPTAVARFGLDQQLVSLNQDFTLARPAHSLKTGVTVDRSDLGRLGTGFKSGRFVFPDLNSFLRGQPVTYVGTTLDSADSFDFINWYWAAYLQSQVRLHSNLYVDAGIRLEYATVPKEASGRTASLANPAADSQVVVGKPFRPMGAQWSPRLGIAWSIRPRTVARAGFGLHHDLLLLPFTVHIGATGMPPFVQRVTLRNPTFPHPSLAVPAGVVSPQPLDILLQAPTLYQYNAGLQHQLARHLSLTVAYAGSRGTNLFRRGDVNLAVPVVGSDGRLFFPAGATRKNPAFGAITLIRSDGQSSYHALQTGVKKTFSAGLELNVFYVFSRAIDNGSAEILAPDAGGGAGNVYNPFGGRAERGLSDFHAKHRLSSDFSLDLPSPSSDVSLVAALLGRWQMNGILSLSSGQPFDVFVSSNRSRSLFGATVASGQGIDRPDLTPAYTHAGAVTGNVNRFFNPAAFQLQPAGYFGNLGRNALIGPGYANLDLALVKRTPISMRSKEVSLQIRLEMFNVLNHPNFGFPDRVVFSGTRDNEAPLPTAGLIRSTVAPSRQLQIAIRLSF